MPRRIPDKNTDPRGYQRYWRDRRILEEMKAMAESVAIVAADCVESRVEAYRLAHESIVLAWKAFEESWTK